MNTPTFHFFSYRTAIRFHLTKRLIQLGWEKAPSAQEAHFSDHNLSLNDEVSQHLEYKHLLAQLVAKHCPSIMPLTYWVDEDNYQQVLAKIMYQHYLDQQHPIKLWVLKPSLLNNGDQIKVVNFEQLKQHYQQPNRLGGPHVIQQYIESALIDNRKYTFRMPVVLTNYAGVFIYKQGYINISACPFDLYSPDRKVHITNYVLDGEFANIEQRSTQTIAGFDDIYKQMQRIVSLITQAILKIAPRYLRGRLKIFEIFGFDFMLDAHHKLWLLEINQGPDSPTFEYNCLDEVLWEPFWQDIIDDFVLPIGLNTPPNNHYANFSLVWKKRPWLHFLDKLIK